MEPGSILNAFCPPACVACRSPCDGAAWLCADCVHELNAEAPLWGDPPPGVDQVISGFDHEGPARNLLRAFKFGRMPGLAPLMAGYMAEHLDGLVSDSTVIAVPPSRLRLRLRGFDPAWLLAGNVCDLAGAPPPVSGVIRRTGAGRQRGRGRQERLGAPPRIEPVAGVAGPVLLVDDVITTGATITACAAALRSCGAGRVTALSFTRRV
jgi:predicted amidophosphoribosyltransferase